MELYLLRDLLKRRGKQALWFLFLFLLFLPFWVRPIVITRDPIEFWYRSVHETEGGRGIPITGTGLPTPPFVFLAGKWVLSLFLREIDLHRFWGFLFWIVLYSMSRRKGVSWVWLLIPFVDPSLVFLLFSGSSPSFSLWFFTLSLSFSLFSHPFFHFLSGLLLPFSVAFHPATFPFGVGFVLSFLIQRKFFSLSTLAFFSGAFFYPLFYLPAFFRSFSPQGDIFSFIGFLSRLKEIFFYPFFLSSFVFGEEFPVFFRAGAFLLSLVLLFSLFLLFFHRTGKVFFLSGFFLHLLFYSLRVDHHHIFHGGVVRYFLLLTLGSFPIPQGSPIWKTHRVVSFFHLFGMAFLFVLFYFRVEGWVPVPGEYINLYGKGLEVRYLPDPFLRKSVQTWFHENRIGREERFSSVFGTGAILFRETSFLFLQEILSPFSSIPTSSIFFLERDPDLPFPLKGRIGSLFLYEVKTQEGIQIARGNPVQVKGDELVLLYYPVTVPTCPFSQCWVLEEGYSFDLESYFVPGEKGKFFSAIPSCGDPKIWHGWFLYGYRCIYFLSYGEKPLSPHPPYLPRLYIVVQYPFLWGSGNRVFNHP